MISYLVLGSSRLGNQLFQYAFLRTQALRLGVKFYCPHWTGDDIFDLDDQALRADRPLGLMYTYDMTMSQKTVHQYIYLQDNTEIITTDVIDKDAFDRHLARQWYVFKDKIVQRMNMKYASINFDTCVGIHVRLGDKLEETYRFSNKYFFVPRRNYYRKALKKVARFSTVLVFSDDIPKAKKYLEKFPYNFVFMEENSPGEDLYLMTQCRDLVCGSSTLSWWGAFLNKHEDKIIVYPKEGEIRPFAPIHKTDLLLKEWINIGALIPVLDSYPVLNIVPFLSSIYWPFLGRVGSLIRENFPVIFKLIKPFFPDKKL